MLLVQLFYLLLVTKNPVLKDRLCVRCIFGSIFTFHHSEKCSHLHYTTKKKSSRQGGLQVYFGHHGGTELTAKETGKFCFSGAHHLLVKYHGVWVTVGYQ